MWNYTPTARLWKEASGLPWGGGPPTSQSSRNPPLPSRPRIELRAGNRTESSRSSVQGGLTTINPAPLSRLGSLKGPASSSARSALPNGPAVDAL